MNKGSRLSTTTLNEDTGYKYVYKVIKRGGDEMYEAKLRTNGVDKCLYFKTSKEAAIAVDKHLISQGKEPINVLKRK